MTQKVGRYTLKSDLDFSLGVSYVETLT